MNTSLADPNAPTRRQRCSPTYLVRIREKGSKRRWTDVETVYKRLSRAQQVAFALSDHGFDVQLICESCGLLVWDT